MDGKNLLKFTGMAIFTGHEGIENGGFVLNINDTPDEEELEDAYMRYARIFYILAHKGTGTVIRLQIAPKKPPADRRFIGGKSGKRHIQCLLQDIRRSPFIH